MYSNSLLLILLHFCFIIEQLDFFIYFGYKSFIRCKTNIFMFIFFIDFRKREREMEKESERTINLLFYLFVHSLVDFYMGPD